MDIKKDFIHRVEIQIDHLQRITDFFGLKDGVQLIYKDFKWKLDIDDKIFEVPQLMKPVLENK